jgi:lipopolysaccharide biosynthesis glycosyltransferase
MSDNRGAVYIAIGDKAKEEAEMSAVTLKKFNNINDTEIEYINQYPIHIHTNKGNATDSRWAKVNLDRLTSYDNFAYIDADTRVRGNIMHGFDILDDGWEMAITASDNQERDWCWHVGEDERYQTELEYLCKPLQLQAGVMFVRKCPATHRLFEIWREEWLKWQDQDQAALLRALKRAPVKLWILGKDYNGGRLVSHLYGKLRNK